MRTDSLRQLLLDVESLPKIGGKAALMKEIGEQIAHCERYKVSQTSYGIVTIFHKQSLAKYEKLKEEAGRREELEMEANKPRPQVGVNNYRKGW